jgi:hypothetical protein
MSHKPSKNGMVEHQKYPPRTRGNYTKRDRLSLILILISLSQADGCASPRIADKPLLVAPPLPERYLTGDFIEYYPEASKRAHETGEVIVQFAVAGDGAVQHITVNEQRSAPYLRLFDAATKMLKGLKLAVGDEYKTSLSMSIVFEIAPCGNVSHSSGPDYYTFLCIDPIPPIPFQTGPEFMIWPEVSKLTLEERESLGDRMNGYARSIHLPALSAHSPDELRVWVGHWEHPATAGFIVSDSSEKKCTLPGDSANSNAGHCTTPDLVAARCAATWRRDSRNTGIPALVALSTRFSRNFFALRGFSTVRSPN